MTYFTVPCFSGAPWDVSYFEKALGSQVVSYRMPEGRTTIEEYAKDVLERIAKYKEVVLVGDSFGGVVALAAAIHRPSNLRGLVMSGAFAKLELSFLDKIKYKVAARLSGKLYKNLTLRLHAQSLASPFDHEGDTPQNTHDFYTLFRNNTSEEAFKNRLQVVLDADLREGLSLVNVPSVIMTPEYDSLVGPEAAEVLKKGLKNSREIILPKTGHMFRFTHRAQYAEAIRSLGVG